MEAKSKKVKYLKILLIIISLIVLISVILTIGIGVGSVVNKDIPSNSVAVGNPCKVIKSLET